MVKFIVKHKLTWSRYVRLDRTKVRAM